MLPAARSAGPARSAALRDGARGDLPKTMDSEILARIAKGASNKEVARDLDIAQATVKTHGRHILRNRSLSSRVQAAVYLTGRSN